MSATDQKRPLFRQQSFARIGPAAMLSQAIGGLSGPPNPSAVFCLRGAGTVWTWRVAN